MSLSLPLGGTQTGGTATTFVDTGAAVGGERSLMAPTSTLLLPRIIKFKASVPTTTPANPGRAESSVRLILGNRVAEEGCCTVKPGTVLVDLKFSWPLDQPETLVDEALSWVQGLAFSQALEDLIKLGRIPT